MAPTPTAGADAPHGVGPGGAEMVRAGRGDGVRRGRCAGAALAVAVDLRLFVVGAAAILAATLYTGGPKPYGYPG